MSGAEDLFKLARGQTRDQLRAIWKKNGPAAAGVVAEGWVHGIRDALQEFLGPEDTYGMLQRHADSAAEPLLLTKVNDILKG